jgi:predicted transcriptional regulator
MPDPPPQVPEAELSVLRALWQRSPQTARELAEAVYGAAGRNEMGTVQKLLQRLEAKALVVRERHSEAHRFSPNISRGTFAGQQLEQLAEKLTDGSLTPFLTHFVEGGRLSKRDREAIRRLLDQTARRGRKP